MPYKSLGSTDTNVDHKRAVSSLHFSIADDIIVMIADISSEAFVNCCSILLESSKIHGLSTSTFCIRYEIFC